MKPRPWLYLAWAILPLPAWWFHHRYGPLLEDHDRAGQLIQTVSEQTTAGNWSAVQASEGQLLGLLPNDDAHQDDRLRAQLAIEDAKAHQAKQSEAVGDLLEMQRAIDSDPRVSESVRSDLRFELAKAEFFNGWRMRLDGAPQWLTHMERARQQYRYLTESTGDPARRAAAVQNTEAAIRIERMDLSELRAIPPDKDRVQQQASTTPNPDDDQQKKEQTDVRQNTDSHGNLGARSTRPHKGS